MDKYIKLTRSRVTPLDTALQAIRLLDAAGELAIRQGNTDLMFTVADKFIDLAGRLSPPLEEEEEDTGEDEGEFKIGFQA